PLPLPPFPSPTLFRSKAFPDTVAKGAHVIDIHATDSNEQNGLVVPRQEYNIPFGCLVPKGSVNIVTAGRCLDADGAGFGSARVIDRKSTRLNSSHVKI